MEHQKPDILPIHFEDLPPIPIDKLDALFSRCRWIGDQALTHQMFDPPSSSSPQLKSPTANPST